MPRRPRRSSGGQIYHVLNRRHARRPLFSKRLDYQAFQRVLEEAQAVVQMRLLSFCLMPTHWHLVLWPVSDGDLSQYMQWLTATHTQRWHKHRGTTGSGPLYQGRFKSFPVQHDKHFYTVCRYVERNPLRAELVRCAESWQWSSLWQRQNGASDVTLEEWPLPLPQDWLEQVNSPQTTSEVDAIRHAVQRGSPFGDDTWKVATAQELKLEHTLRPRGRPRNGD